MKNNKILFLSLFLFSGNMFSQITVVDTDISSIGDIVYQAYDPNPVPAIAIGNSGLNQSWDFSLLQQSSLNTVSFISPVGTSYENQYPAANLCMDDNSSLSYYEKTSSGVFLHGVGDTVFSSPALFYPLPLTFGLNISDGPIIVIDTAITGPFLSIAIPPATVTTLSNGVANRADTALIEITNTTDFSVDASGSLTTHLGIFDVLRLKRVQTTNSVLHVYCLDTISGMGIWVNNIPFSSIPFLAGFSNNEIEYKYQWITNDNSVQFLLAEATVDDLDNIIGGISFQTTATTSCVFHDNEVVNIFPVPATDYLNIELLTINNAYFHLFDLSGKVLFEQMLSSSNQLDMSFLAKGMYYLVLDVDNQLVTKQIIIE